jgi:hypothetical protein
MQGMHGNNVHVMENTTISTGRRCRQCYVADDLAAALNKGLGRCCYLDVAY